MDNDGSTPEDDFRSQKSPEENEQICNEEWRGNCFCDNQNNNEACNFDDGDCCRKTCEANVVAKITIPPLTEKDDETFYP